MPRIVPEQAKTVAANTHRAHHIARCTTIAATSTPNAQVISWLPDASVGDAVAVGVAVGVGEDDVGVGDGDEDAGVGDEDAGVGDEDEGVGVGVGMGVISPTLQSFGAAVVPQLHLIDEYSAFAQRVASLPFALMITNARCTAARFSSLPGQNMSARASEAPAFCV